MMDSIYGNNWSFSDLHTSLQVSTGIRVIVVLLIFTNVSFAAGREAAIQYVTEAPQIDGDLDDTIWTSITPVSDFRQVAPVENGKPSERTEVRLAFDKDAIYIGIRCYDRDPDAIIAKELRDGASLDADDSISIMFDTFLDRRNAFQFEVNPLGTKAEARLENNESSRPEWQGIWYAAGKKDKKEWVVEMAIPVKTLTFDPELTSWGLEIQRSIRRRNEIVRWANTSQDHDTRYVAAYGKLTGFSGLSQGLGLEIKPALAAQFRFDRDTDDRQFVVKPGGELVYKLTPSLTTSLLLNPDFSDAAVDELRSNLSRFSLFFPEQRDFFIRDADIFEFGGLRQENGQAFFSRRIGLNQNLENVDIKAGGKLTGRVGRYTLGLLNSYVEGHGDVKTKNLLVVRPTADVFKESRLGAIFTYGAPLTNGKNDVAGLDYHYRNSELFGGKTFFVDSWIQRSSGSGLNSDNLAYGVRLNYPNDTWDHSITFREVQANFNLALGFVNRRNIRLYDGLFSYRFRPENSSWIRSIRFGFFPRFFTNTDNELETTDIAFQIIRLENHQGDSFNVFHNILEETLTEPFAVTDAVTIPAGKYKYKNTQIRLETSNSRLINFELGLKAGGFFSGNIIEFSGKIEWQPSPRLFFSLNYENINTSLPQGDFSTEITQLRLNINFNPRLSWTNLIQKNTEDRTIGLQSQLRWIMEVGSELTWTLNQDWVKEDQTFVTDRLELTGKFFWTYRF